MIEDVSPWIVVNGRLRCPSPELNLVNGGRPLAAVNLGHVNMDQSCNYAPYRSPDVLVFQALSHARKHDV